MRAAFTLRLSMVVGTQRYLRSFASCQSRSLMGLAASRSASMSQARILLNTPFRSFTGDAEAKPSKPKVLQDLPTQKFWEQIFDVLDLDEIVGEDGQSTKEEIKITKWYKTPRSPVKAGEKIFEVEAASVMMDLCADHAGFLGERLVEEGEVLTRGKLAAQILDVPRTVADLSDEVMQEELSKAEGSIRTFEQSIERFNKERRLIKDDLSLACRLAGHREVEFGPVSFAARLPGNQNVLVASPPNVDFRVVSSSSLQEVETGKEDGASADSSKPPAPLPADLQLVKRIFREHRDVSCVLLGRPFHATTVAQLDSSLKDEVAKSIESRVNANIALSSVPLLTDDDAALPTTNTSSSSSSSSGSQFCILALDCVVVASDTVSNAFLLLKELEENAQRSLLVQLSQERLVSMPPVDQRMV
eukprot:405587-Hanusia_phi.AAC.2